MEPGPGRNEEVRLWGGSRSLIWEVPSPSPSSFPLLYPPVFLDVIIPPTSISKLSPSDTSNNKPGSNWAKKNRND